MCHVHFTRVVWKNVAKKYEKDISDRIKVAFDNEIKMQGLEVELRERGYSKSCRCHRPLLIQLIVLQVVPCRALEKD
jgi:hypothetical protein